MTKLFVTNVAGKISIGDTITGGGLDGYKVVATTGGRGELKVADRTDAIRDIRVTRDRLGMTTAELARLVGVRNRTAHGWLAGKPVPEPVWRLLETILAHPDICATLAFCDWWKAVDRQILDGTAP